MTQSRRYSLFETITSTAIGYLCALLSQAVLYPMFGIHTSTGQNAWLAAWFTIISIVRGYLVRRAFNWRQK